MKKKIAIVSSMYYQNISNDLLSGAKKILNFNKKFCIYDIIAVPGAFEIPFIISKKINSYDAFIALGCIIKGKTPHFEFISQSITNAIMYITVKSKKPVGNGIITCLNMNQAKERSSIQKKNKGMEATNAVINVLRTIK